LLYRYLKQTYSWDRSDVATRYGLEAAIWFHERNNFAHSTPCGPALGSAQSPVQVIPDALSLGLKRPGRDTHHSLSCSAEVNNGGAIPPFPDIIYHIVLN
jgi:hypothetical protein